MRRAAILLLEDDRLYSETLRDFLENEGYRLTCAYDPYSAFELCYEGGFDLYLFDINLPFQDGIRTFQELRESGDRTPTIFLTSREDTSSLVRGLELGAEDYLRKPIRLEELSARIQAVLRRRNPSDVVKLGSYVLDRRRRDLLHDGEPLHLGRKLYDLLELLTEYEEEVVEFERIRERLWPEGEVSEGALRVYITRLKRLLGARIENVRGVGYRLRREGKE